MKNTGKQARKQPVSQLSLFGNRIFINSRIDDKLVDSVIEILNIAIDVHKEIIIFLNSPGGDYLPAKRLYEKLENIPEDIKVIGIAETQISSAAAIIFQSFDVRFIYGGTKMLLHSLEYTPSVTFIPYVTSKRKTRRLTKNEIKTAYSLQNYFNSILMDRSGMSERRIIKLLRKRTTLNASQILELGLADKIFNPSDLY